MDDPHFETIEDIIEFLESPTADQTYLGEDYTIADLIHDLNWIKSGSIMRHGRRRKK